MKITLISPPCLSLTTSPPLGLGCIAAILEKNNYSVKILDFTKAKISIKEAANSIKQTNPDLIGISISTPRFPSAKLLIKEIKKEDKDIPILVGGAHISALPLYSLKDLQADWGIIGEGEFSTLKLVKSLENNQKDFSNLKGLIYKEDSKIKLAAPPEPIEDLNSLPFPSWQQISPKSYPPNPWQLFYKRFPVAPIITSRGCPYSCIYCASHVTQGKKFRSRSAENVVEEMEYLIKDFEVKEFQVLDDCFNFKVSHALSICEEIIRKRLNIVWKTPNGILLDNLNTELLKAMKESGCYELGFGIESADEEVLRKNKKKLNIKGAYQRLKEVKNIGIETYGFFMLGLLGDTQSSIKRTISFAKEAPLDLAHFSLCIPLPGSELFENYIKDESLENIDWERFYYFNPFNLSSIPPQKLKKEIRRALFGFYFNISRLITILKRIKLRQISYFLRLILSYTGSNKA